MILPYQDLMKLGKEGKLVSPFNESQVNPASYDICIGDNIILERQDFNPNDGDSKRSIFYKRNIEFTTEENPWIIDPGECFLAETLESLMVPNNMAMELKLKSSMARRGWNHALAFYFDPGWSGIGTMEIMNVNRYQSLPIWSGMRFAQIIYHLLTAECEKPYKGRYQNANTVESASSLPDGSSRA